MAGRKQAMNLKVMGNREDDMGDGLDRDYKRSSHENVRV